MGIQAIIMKEKEHLLKFTMHQQPDGVSCGPTCLNAIYQYWGNQGELQHIRHEIDYTETGGTLAVLLGKHALKQGFKAKLQSVNIEIVDPTWFACERDILMGKLLTQLAHTSDLKKRKTTQAYFDFLELGGEIQFFNLTFEFIQQAIEQGVPILSGVCATWLYQNMRDYTDGDNRVVYDEWLGKPTGHFVVIYGYEPQKQLLYIADPYLPHPLSNSHHYTISFSHWLHAHLLGIMSHDAELLMIKK